MESHSGEVYSIQHYVIKFVSDLRQIGGFLQVLRFPPPMKVAYSTITLTPFYQSGIQCGIIFWGSSTFHSCKENQEEKNEMWKVRNIKWNLSKSLKIPESRIHQIISQCSKSLLIKLLKPNTFLFWTQKLVPVRFGLDRFHWRKQMSCKL